LAINKESAMPVVLTFGDSNTHGTPPIVDLAKYDRFDAATRWPRRMIAALGAEWELVEEGLPGRTAQFDDPVMGPHMNGQAGLKMALESHGPIDVLVLMLGTNDVKARFSALPEQVASGIAALLDVATHRVMQERHGGFKVLLICPAPVEEVGPIKAEFFGGTARSRALPPLFRALAANYDAAFLDAGEVIAVSPLDGVHFDAAAHAALARVVAEKLREMV
jgi:lysophospholipase L1-like esterase